MNVMSSSKDLIDAAPEDVGMSSARLANLTRLMQGYVDEGKLAGAITLVARRDRVVHFETYGMADIESGRGMQPDTIFRIASMTKPIVSVALMTLYEEGTSNSTCRFMSLSRRFEIPRSSLEGLQKRTTSGLLHVLSLSVTSSLIRPDLKRS
jgi:hypothetical protein